MASRSRSQFRALPWLILGPLLVVAGAIMGRAYPELIGGANTRVWTEPTNVARAADDDASTAGMPSLAPVIEAVRPGVVAITTVRARSAVEDVPPPPIRRDTVRIGVPTLEPGGVGTVRGSGFVVHQDGLIVTSYHVVADYASIHVALADHRTFTARVVGVDPISDLALLRLDDAPSNLTVLPLGDSSRARQGDWVMSIGHPFEFHHSLSVGLITFVGRHLTEEGIHVTNEYLQFSAPVNPGESGAPLFDMAGHVIGVTRRTLTDGRGISFAIPSKLVKALLRAVERGDSYVRRGYLGMEFRAPSRPEELRGLVVEGGGAEVTRVIEGHPADSAGVRIGDVILRFDGDPVTDAAELYERITVAAPGSRKPMSVLRDGAVLAPVTVTLGEVGKPSID